MTKTMTEIPTHNESFIASLSTFNTFTITHSENDPRIPNPFTCSSIETIDFAAFNVEGIVFKRRFLSDITIYRSLISASMKLINDHSAIYFLHMQDDLNSENIITIKASYDPSVYIPTQPCQINDSFNSNKMIDYLMNPDFYDPNRSRPDDCLYVIDPNRLGIMTQRQEYIFENFMRFNLEQECYHDVLKTVCFLVKDWEISVGLYNLESDAIEEMYGLDGVI